MARELLQRPTVARYRLRDVPAVVPIRHGRAGIAGSADAFVLHEVFRSRLYEPPEPVAASLDLAKPGPRVVDLGANLGFFSLFTLLRYPSAEITAFEPDPENALLLREVLRRNGVDHGVELIEACAATEDGWLRFATGNGCESRVDSDGEARAEARDVFPYLCGVDLLKIDIEGAEWPLLADERLAEALPGAILLEYHSIGCPGDNAKREATDRLKELGYTVVHGQPELVPDDRPFWGCGVLWAYRRSS